VDVENNVHRPGVFCSIIMTNVQLVTDKRKRVPFRFNKCTGKNFMAILNSDKALLMMFGGIVLCSLIIVVLAFKAIIMITQNL